MTTRTFRVPPDFPTRGGGGAEALPGGEAGAPDPFATPGAAEGAATGPRLSGRKNAKDVLVSLGVTFSDGSFASFDASSGRLVVKNTYDQLDLVDTLVEGMINITVKQVYITTKFVEVTQRNTDELGFDWLLGASISAVNASSAPAAPPAAPAPSIPATTPSSLPGARLSAATRSPAACVSAPMLSPAMPLTP